MLLQILLTHLLVLQVFAFPTTSYTISARDFGLDLIPTIESTTSRTPAETNTITRTSSTSIVSSTPISESQKPSTTIDSAHTHENNDQTPSPASTSSIPIQQTQSSTSTISTSPESEITSTGLPPTHIGTTKESNAQSTDSSNGGRQWKIVGITVLCITVALAAIYLLLFFDSWWGFVRSVFTRGKRGGGMEDLQPDWEKQTWEYSSGQRFPGETEKEDRLAFTPPTVPPATYSQSEDPHPLDPMFRRPSARPFPDFKTPSY
ncbi:hypothetical protein EDD85DRAFT_803422 [Armillaria nabsnona]|nr:hypothetical protein EDD85DRAFT_803422 [Armillaria nabsnona]